MKKNDAVEKFVVVLFVVVVVITFKALSIKFFFCLDWKSSKFFLLFFFVVIAAVAVAFGGNGGGGGGDAGDDAVGFVWTVSEEEKTGKKSWLSTKINYLIPCLIYRGEEIKKKTEREK